MTFMRCWERILRTKKVQCAVKVKVGILTVALLAVWVLGDVAQWVVPDFAEGLSAFILLGHLILRDFQVSRRVPRCSGLAKCLLLRVYVCSFICVLGTRESGAQHGCDKDRAWHWHRTNAKWVWVSYCQRGRFICPIMHYEDCIKGELQHMCYIEGWSVWVRAYRSCQCFCYGFGQVTLLGFRC